MPDQATTNVTGTMQKGILVVTILVDQIRDHTHAYAVRDEILALIDESKSPDVVIDLLLLTFMGSVGILAFLGVRRKLHGGRIVLCNIHKNLHGMFQIGRLISTDPNSQAPFEADGTVDDALNRLLATSAS
jgi:anti-anti-sigma factor